MKKIKQKAHNPYEEYRSEGEFTLAAPFNFILKDPGRKEVDGKEVWDKSYQQAASNIYLNNVFHREMALLSAELANQLTKENFDAITKALWYVKQLSTRFESLHAKLVELENEAIADRESVQKSSSDISGSLEYSVDFQV